MDLLEDLKISILNFNFAIIYKIHKILVLHKNQLNYAFIRNIIDFFKKTFTTYNNGKLKP